jgi:hypothetical protein
VTLSSFPHLWEHGIPREGEDDCWVGEVMVLRVTAPCEYITIVFILFLCRLKQWRTDPCYKCLEIQYAELGNMCSKCTHMGKVQKHAKSGCEMCATKYGCIQTTDMNHLSQKDP